MADFTIADVLAWARTKPAGESYYYGSNSNCALCQFLRETGRAVNPTAGGSAWSDWSVRAYVGSATPDRAIPDDIARALMDNTFGGLVKRLEALCPTTPVTQAGWAAIDSYLTDIDAVSADKLAPASIQPHTV